MVLDALRENIHCHKSHLEIRTEVSRRTISRIAKAVQKGDNDEIDRLVNVTKHRAGPKVYPR